MKKKFELLGVVILLCVGLACIACAPQQAAKGPVQNTDAEASTMDMPTWSSSSDCVSCHTVEAQSVDNAAAGYSVHAVQPNMACTVCHTDDNGTLTKVHENYSTAKKPTKLKKTEVLPDRCTASGCHDISDIQARTASVTVLTDENGTTVNPHDLPVNEDHALVTCISCHGMHSVNSPESTAPKACLTCHHKGTYECGTCH